MVGTVTQQEIKQLDNAVLSVTIRAATVCSYSKTPIFMMRWSFRSKKALTAYTMPCASCQKISMTLDKAIKCGKEKRKKYSGSKAIDCSCRNHGTCAYCESGRQHFDKKRRSAADDQIEEWENGN